MAAGNRAQQNGIDAGDKVSRARLRTLIPDLADDALANETLLFRGDRLSCRFRTVVGSLLAFGGSIGPKRCQTFGMADERLVETLVLREETAASFIWRVIWLNAFTECESRRILGT